MRFWKSIRKQRFYTSLNNVVHYFFTGYIIDKVKAQQTQQKKNDANFDWDTFKSYVRRIIPEHIQFNIPLMAYDDL